ncbi:terminase gpP N-terminus-related DNA-binding protein [Enterobacter cloacae]|uniref:terminase gpP N-terminus-related DNA-binding protein n=1 Tax=Enterobacter cloacae TaxID=550 RepID=UPI000E2E9FC6
MARARDTNRAIAKMFGVPEKTIGSWKSKDNWNEKLNGVPRIKQELRKVMYGDG